MALYLAVDAGGTRTTFLLADETRELARVAVGSIKRMRTDAATAEINLDSALGQLATLSRRSLVEIVSVCVGAAGNTVPSVADWIREHFERRIAVPCLLLGDVAIALDAAFRGKPGVLILAGTGSNVAGRLGSGEIVTAGGWGPAISDQASGLILGRAGLRAAVLEHDEQGASALLGSILDFWGLPEFQALVEFANRQPSPDLSQLAPLIVAAARGGDPVAMRVLENEAREMAHLAGIVVRRVRASIAAGAPLLLAYAGSIMQHVPEIRDGITALLREGDPGVEAVRRLHHARVRQLLRRRGLRCVVIGICSRSEDFMQKLVASHPELIADLDGALLLIRREQPIADREDGGGRWSLDHLFVTRTGVAARALRGSALGKNDTFTT